MDRFKLGKKWFWIGFVVCLNPVFGLVYSIALLVEKDHRKEGTILLIWTIVWAIFINLLNYYLVKSGIMPKFRLENRGALNQIIPH